MQGSAVAFAVKFSSRFVKNPCFAGARRRVFFLICKKFLANPTMSRYAYRLLRKKDGPNPCKDIKAMV
jgi:hypothetical protein